LVAFLLFGFDIDSQLLVGRFLRGFSSLARSCGFAGDKLDGRGAPTNKMELTRACG
jgi:hypothetical protein